MKFWNINDIKNKRPPNKKKNNKKSKTGEKDDKESD
jgi:hypothetical protein